MATALVTGANRGLGLGFVTQLLSRPEKYARVIAAARTYDSNDTESGLGKLVRESKGRLGVVRLEEVGEVESCLKCVDHIRQLAPGGVNLLINNAGFANQPKPMTPLRLPTVEGAVDYYRTWTVNAFGPLLLSSALLDADLLRPTPSSLSSSASSSSSIQPSSDIFTSQAELPSTMGGADPMTESNLVRPPVIVNISSGQASLSRASEMFDGGSPRDDLFFHQVYAASKVALSGVTMHMARILRDQVIVGQVHPGWIKTTMGRTYANLTTEESAGKVLDVVSGWTTLKHSGRYVDEEGRTIGW